MVVTFFKKLIASRNKAKATHRILQPVTLTSYIFVISIGMLLKW